MDQMLRGQQEHLQLELQQEVRLLEPQQRHEAPVGIGPGCRLVENPPEEGQTPCPHCSSSTPSSDPLRRGTQAPLEARTPWTMECGGIRGTAWRRT